MLIVYDKDTKKIVRTEDYSMKLTLPEGTIEEQKARLAVQNQDFIAIPYELGVYIFNFTLNFNADGVFVGLQPVVL